MVATDKPTITKAFMNDSSFFSLDQVSVWRGDNQVLCNFSLELFHGQNVAILGPNGSGKSTLMQLLAGDLHSAWSAGSHCRLFGEDYWSLEEMRHRIGIVTPEQWQHFDPQDSGVDVVLSALRGAYGPTLDDHFTRSESRRAHAAMKAAAVDHLAARAIGTLSSGERRRLLIARALVHDPPVLVMDEPSTALDFAGALQLTQTLRQAMQLGKTLVLVTHHPEEIPPEIERVILLQAGKIIADGPKKKIMTAERLSQLYGIALHLRWHDGWCRVRADV